MTTETAPAQDIHTAILAVMRQVGYVQKESAAGLNYTFASERALIEALRPAMIEAGITMYVGATDELREGEVLTKKGSVAQYARVLLSVVFTHAPSQTHVRVQVPGGAMDWGDKAISKALTMAYKYALRQTFVIETGDDADEDVLPELEETGWWAGREAAAGATPPEAAPRGTQEAGSSEARSHQGSASRRADCCPTGLGRGSARMAGRPWQADQGADGFQWPGHDQRRGVGHRDGRIPGAI